MESLHRVHLLLVHVIELHAALVEASTWHVVLAEVAHQALVHVVRILLVEEVFVFHHHWLAVCCKGHSMMDTVVAHEMARTVDI